MKSKYDVLITDGDQRVALEIVRSLGEAGLKVVVSELDTNSSKPLSAASKYCCDFISVPSYSCNDFLELCTQCEVVIPVSTNTIIQCLKNASAKYPDRFLLPSTELFNKVNDKYSLSKIAKKIGVVVPKSIEICEEADCVNAAAAIGYPVVLKLCNDEGMFLSPGDRYRIVSSEAELGNAWRALSQHGKEILMQEYIIGVGVGLSAVYDKKHSCVMSFQHKRLREYPIDGGPSTYCESINQKNIGDVGRKLLDALEWTGPAMVEFKYDYNSQRLVLLEINPRYWGSLPLARKSGLNFPLAHFNLIAEKVFETPLEYQEGRKLKFFITDLIATLKEMSRSRNYIKGFLSYIGELFDAKLSWGLWMLKDPLPSLRYILSRLR